MSEDAASLHLKVNTSEVDKGKKALDDLAKTGEKTEKSIKDLGTESVKSGKSVEQLAESGKTARIAFSSFASVIAALGLVALARESAMLSSRFETMGIVMRIAGNNAGYTASQMEMYSKSLQKSGISMLQSRNALVQLATANIDLAKASAIGRAAQDLAVVANVNSSEAMERMIHGIKSGEVEVLKTLGLNVSFESSYKSLARQLGVNSTDLTENQKVMARTNIVIAESARFAGIYEESMTTAGKAITSLARYWENLKIKMGEAFLPTLADVVFKLTDALKAANEQLDKMGASGLIKNIGDGLHKAFKVMFETIAIGGANVAYVFEGIGREIGGLAAQAAAILSGDLSRVAQIRKDMIADNEAAKKALDAFTASILGNGTATSTTAKISEAERIAAGKASREAAEAAAKSGKAADEAAKAAQKHAEAYGNLIEGITRRIAAAKQEASLGRELTEGEKLRSDAMANSASGVLRLSKGEQERYAGLTRELDALNKLSAATEKLKKAREEIAGIVTSAETANAEYLERLEFENSLIGKSALQVAQLTAAYQSNLTLKRQFADIDKATKGLTDPTAIAKLKAESDARIKAIKDEARAKIEAQYIADVQQTIKVRSDPAITQEMGARLMPEEVARRTAAAKAEHDAALAKIADLDVIHGRLKIEEELKAKINKAELEAHDIELARATGASIMADEAAEKIAKYGADNVAYAEAALAISRDTGLQEYRGFEERNKQLQARVEFFTAEAEAKKSALGVSANQLEFDKANILLQQQLYQIQLDAGDLDEQKKLGLAHQIKMQDELIGFLARKRNLDMSQVGSGEELIEINKELLRLKKAINGLDVGAEAKAKAQADAAKTQLEAAQRLADTAKKTMNANMVQQFESDFHNGMLRLLEAGNTSWGAMMKGWKNSFKVNVVDYIYKQFAKPFVFKFIASMAGLVGANGLATAAGVQADAGMMGKVSGMDWMSIGSSLWKGMSNGFAAFGDTISLGIDRLAALAYDNGLSSAGSSLASNSAAAGTAASYLGAGLAGVTIGTFIAGDKTLLGMNGMTTSVLGAALSAALLPGLGPIGLFIGGIAGGALNALFGRGPKEYGTTTVRGGFSGEGFAGNMVTPWTQKGGVFRSNKSGEDITPLEEQAQQFLNSFVGKSGASFARLITLSGDAARSVDGWNFEINRALTTEEDMTKLFGDMADSMGTHVIPELEKFRAKGENLADTAVRMGDEYVITESIFRMMGFTAAATGIASLGMRDSLIQLMGGIQQTSATMDSYYKNFYTADEQQANSLRQVNDAFKVLGLVAPTTRDGFRALAETLVKDTTPAGQALFASVMALNPAFAAVTQSTEDMAAAMVQSAKDIADAQNAIIDAAKKTLDAAFAGVQRAVQAERDSITKQYTESLSVVNASISKLTSLSSALKSSVAGLNPLGRSQAQAEIKTALMLAKLGVFPTADSMARSLQSVAQPSEQLFRTFEDYKRDQILTSNDIEALGKLTDDQLSVEERTLKTLEDMQAGEMSRLDGILKSAQDQIDAINGVNNSVLSVAAALFAMSAALTNFQLQSVTTSAMQTGMGITNVNGLLAFSGGDASAAASSSTGYSASEILARRLGQRAAIDSVASPISSPVAGVPSGAFNINDMSTWTQAQKDDWRTGGKWPSFAVGTNYVPHDMTARIHEGEAIIPKAYNRNNDATNAALVAVIEELKAEVKQARIEANANALPIAVNTSKSAKLAEKWEGLGMPVTRT